jgi:hypothetical protein
MEALIAFNERGDSDGETLLAPNWVFSESARRLRELEASFDRPIEPETRRMS